MLLLIVFVPFALLGVRNKPEDVGLEPDGFNTKKDEKIKPVIGATVVKEAAEDWMLSEAKKTKAFWAILICVGIPAMVNTGITFHIISIFGSNELSPAVAAMVLSLMAAVGIPMSFVSGIITDRIPTNYMLVAIFIIEMILLLLLLITTNFIMAVLFGVIWGIANGLERIALNVIWPNYFGRKHIGSINGIGVTVGVIGSSLGPLPFGIGYDLFHNYTFILLATLIFPIIGLICSIIAKKPSKSQLVSA